MEIRSWREFRNAPRIGYGKEGIVLRLSETECVKVYSPIRQAVAEREYFNLGLMLERDLAVPRPRTVVKINVEREVVMLPRWVGNEIRVVAWHNVESLSGIIREYVPGTVLDGVQQRTSTEQALRLLGYVDAAVDAGVYLEDAIPGNFVDTGSQVYCVDCSEIKTKQDFAAPDFFQQHSLSLRARLLQLLCLQAEKPFEVLEKVYGREYAPR